MATLYKANGEQKEIVQSERFSLEQLQSFVGGWIELVSLVDGRDMYINEDGKQLALPKNSFATFLADLAGIADEDFIVGDVIVLTIEEMERQEKE